MSLLTQIARISRRRLYRGTAQAAGGQSIDNVVKATISLSVHILPPMYEDYPNIDAEMWVSSLLLHKNVNENLSLFSGSLRPYS